MYFPVSLPFPWNYPPCSLLLTMGIDWSDQTFFSAVWWARAGGRSVCSQQSQLHTPALNVPGTSTDAHQWHPNRTFSIWQWSPQMAERQKLSPSGPFLASSKLHRRVVLLEISQAVPGYWGTQLPQDTGPKIPSSGARAAHCLHSNTLE